MTIFRSKLIGFSTILLVACSQGKSADDRICNTPSALDVAGASAASSPDEQATLTTSCVHRWAYRLAKAEGSHGEIASAVVGGCREAIDVEANLYLETSKDGLTTPELERIRRRLEREYSEMALFHVVQARAGRCDVP